MDRTAQIAEWINEARAVAVEKLAAGEIRFTKGTAAQKDFAEKALVAAVVAKHVARQAGLIVGVKAEKSTGGVLVKNGKCWVLGFNHFDKVALSEYDMTAEGAMDDVLSLFVQKGKKGIDAAQVLDIHKDSIKTDERIIAQFVDYFMRYQVAA